VRDHYRAKWDTMLNGMPYIRLRADGVQCVITFFDCSLLGVFLCVQGFFHEWCVPPQRAPVVGYPTARERSAESAGNLQDRAAGARAEGRVGAVLLRAAREHRALVRLTRLGSVATR
jgi:hypothetical protein